ncbi:MAG: serine/threonine protein kinase [Gemmataceae bacterium]|nr:serine/threonine protein kinase [Gemmataceae bacterium]
MTSTVQSPDLASCSVAAIRRIDEVCDSFEEALRGERPPRLEDYLGSVEAPLLPALLRQLLLLEWEFRQVRDGAFDLDDYLARFSGHAALVREACEQHAAETATESKLFAPPTEPLAEAGAARDLVASGAPSASDWHERGYTIVSELGQGGMGAVYLACQTAADRLVALKVLQENLHADPAALERFRQEAMTLARLQHPNIVPVFEVDTCRGRSFYTMEYCAGGSLAEHLRGTPLSPAEAATMLATVAGAVHAAHQAGIIHRDLKPGNILLSGRVSRGMGDCEAADAADTAADSPLTTHSFKLADFGLAKKLDAAPHTQTGVILGTPQYMAPEQARGESKAVGAAADVYALGAILYQCLTGRPPFLAATQVETLRQVIDDEPVPPRRLQPKLARDLETICLKCLRKDPQSRYASALALADDLRRHLEGRPIQARPLGPALRTWRWCRRNRAVAGLLALLSVVLLGGLASTTFMWLRAEDNYVRAENLHVEAEKNFDDTVAAIETYYRKVSENRLLLLPGMAGLRRELMTAARPYFEQFVEHRRHDPRLRHQLAMAHLALADIDKTLGAAQRSLPHFEEARARLRELHDQDPDT